MTTGQYDRPEGKGEEPIRDRLNWYKKQIPPSWPKWKRQCTSLSWRSGKPCQQPSVMGTDRCARHGGRGRVHATVGWRRYLLWLLLPETIRTNNLQSPVLDQEVELICNILAQYMVTGDAHASESARMKAIEFLFDSVALQKHHDPALLLTHLKRSDAETAVEILRLNGLLK